MQALVLRPSAERPSLRELARAADVRPNTLRHYFGDRDGVIVAVLEQAGLDGRAYMDALANIPLGTFVHAIEMKPGKGAQLARSAGTSAQLTAREGRFANLKLPSGEVRRVPVDCKATIGTTSNPDHFNIDIGKAGRKRWLGVRPKTRGVAMNPVDHPMGGGEGKASGGHPKSPTGVPAKGYKTRKKNKASNKFIVRRRKAKK